RHLPWPVHLVAVSHAAHAAVPDGDEEILAGHGRMPQHSLDGLSQFDAYHVERGALGFLSLHVASHARRLTKDDVDRNVDGPQLVFAARRGRVRHPGQPFAVGDAQLTLLCRDADHCIGATLALCDGVEAHEILGKNRQNITFLGFIAPDLRCREAGFLQVHLLQLEYGTTSRIVHEFGEGVGQPTGTHIVNRQYRVLFTLLPATVDDFLRTSLDLGIAALNG